MEFWERIEADIQRGKIRNTDDEIIADLERGLELDGNHAGHEKAPGGNDQ